jgi:hypothetical protein
MLKKKIEFFLSFFLIFILTFVFFRGRLGSDDLQAFDFAYNFVNNNINFIDYIGQNQVRAHRVVWIIQNIIIIYSLKIFSLFLNFDILFFSKYFCGWIISFYSTFSIYLCFRYFKKNFIDNNVAFIVCSGIFFGSSFLSYLTGSYIESLVIFLILLRFNVNNRYYILIIDCFLILIKPYYFLIVLPLIILEKNFLKNKIFHFITLLSLFALFKISTYSGFIPFVGALPFNFDLDFITKNIIYIIFSPGFGIIFTSTVPLFLIIIGFQRSSLIKILFIFLFIIFISTLPFWHGQGPGGRYLISSLFIFLPEFVNAIKILRKNKFLLKFLITIILLTLLHLPALEFRNTNIVNYEKSVVYKKNVSEPAKDTDLDSFPYRDLLFQNAIFANLILYYKIHGKDNHVVVLENINFKIGDVYPMTGLQRFIFIVKNKIDYFPKNYFFYLSKYIKLLEFIYYSLFLIFIFFLIKALFKARLSK